jgi:hypothetical protein
MLNAQPTNPLNLLSNCVLINSQCLGSMAKRSNMDGVLEEIDPRLSSGKVRGQRLGVTH